MDDSLSGQLFSYVNKPPVIRGLDKHDRDISYFEHSLFGSGILPKPNLKLFNPSAGTITRSVKYGYVPIVYVDEEYESTEYFLNRVVPRMEELLVFKRKEMIHDINVDSDVEKYLYYTTNDKVQGEYDCYLYVGLSVWELEGNSYTVGFEINPYSYVLEQGLMVSVNADFDEGYEITYQRGREINIVKWKRKPLYYRVESSTFTSVIEPGMKNRKIRSDLYQLCVTEFELIRIESQVFPSIRPILDPILIEYDSIISIALKSGDISRKMELCVLNGEQEAKVIDILGVPYDYNSRQFIIDKFVGRTRRKTVSGKIIRRCISPTLGVFSGVVKYDDDGVSWKNYSLIGSFCGRNTYMGKYTANFDDIYSGKFYAPDIKVLQDEIDCGD